MATSMHCCLGEGRELCTMSPFARDSTMARGNVVSSLFAALYSYMIISQDVCCMQ